MNLQMLDCLSTSLPSSSQTTSALRQEVVGVKVLPDDTKMQSEALPRPSLNHSLGRHLHCVSGGLHKLELRVQKHKNVTSYINNEKLAKGFPFPFKDGTINGVMFLHNVQNLTNQNFVPQDPELHCID